MGAVLLSTGRFTSPSEGPFEPWASDSDPTDVPRSHVQDITTSPFTYHIEQGGTMDGKMCTTLPGVWEPFEQTWESNRSIRMENVGAADVINPWLTIGPSTSSPSRPSRTRSCAGLSTDREKALAIFYFYITHRYHKGNGDNGAQGDVSQAINVFGFNTCGNSTLCMSDLLDKVGMNDCIFSHCPGHCVPQAFFDGRYNTLDGDMATFMLLRDNHTLANELDLVRDHDLVKRVHQYGIMSSMNVRNNEDYATYYTWEGDTTVQLDGWNWWTMGMVLRPRESIEWRWGHETPAKYYGDMTGYPPIAPDTIYNGVWEYAPAFGDDAQWRAGATVTNIANQDGVLTATGGGTGTIIWSMKTPYQFVGGDLTVAGDGYALEIGFLDPKDWKTVYAPLVPAEFDGKFRGRTAAGNEYWLKCTLTGNASLSGAQDQERHPDGPARHAFHDGWRQRASRTPSARTTRRALTPPGRSGSRTNGSSARRRARRAHRRLRCIQPTAATSDGTDVVFRWNAAVDPDGDAIADTTSSSRTGPT